MLTALVPSDLVDGVLVNGAWAVDATPEEIHLTKEAIYRIAALAITKAPATGIVLPAAKTINTGTASGELWGVFTIQINASGTVTALAPTADQVHATEAAALAAALAAATDNVVIGFLTVQAPDATLWTSVVDDLTGDVVSANFSLPTPPNTLFPNEVRPRAFRWVGGTNLAHKCEVADGVTVIWEELVGTGLLTKEDATLAEKFRGPLTQFAVWSLESGKLYIYH